jgi:hypothetical protein
VEASSKKLIDQSYFKSSLDYRQRAGLLLEASLRIAVTMNSYRLAKTIIETVSMFKIGVQDPLTAPTLHWFKSIMTKQYSSAGLPRLAISDLQVEAADVVADNKDNNIEEGQDENNNKNTEDDTKQTQATIPTRPIVTGEMAAITLTMERTHAEAFTKVKIAQCQQQGIPPQIALQAYREGWWVLVRLKKASDDADGNDKTQPYSEVNNNNPLLALLTEQDKQKFSVEQDENRLIVAWPMIVQNMAQKSGKVKIQFKAPPVPGRYTIYLAVKSQEFLGTDQEFELTLDVVDRGDDGDQTQGLASDEESKKDK